MNGVHGGSLFSGLRRPACGRRRRWRMHYHDHRLDQLPTHQPSAHPHPQQEANVARDLESAGGEVRVIAARPDRGRLGSGTRCTGTSRHRSRPSSAVGCQPGKTSPANSSGIRKSPCNSPGSPHKRSTDEHHHSPAGHRPESNLAEVQARIGHSTTTWRCAPTRPCRTRAHLAARKPAFATESVASSRLVRHHIRGVTGVAVDEITVPVHSFPRASPPPVACPGLRTTIRTYVTGTVALHLPSAQDRTHR